MKTVLAASAAFSCMIPALCLAAGPADLYARIDQKLEADPQTAALVGKPAPEMKTVAWMAGQWDVVAEARGDAEKGTSVVTPLFDGAWLEIRDTYPGGTQDVGFIGYDPVLHHWVSVSIDSVMNANRTFAERWDEKGASFEGDVMILGVAAHLRQVIARIGPDAYLLTNEERLADGWHMLDRYRYTRRAAK